MSGVCIRFALCRTIVIGLLPTLSNTGNAALSIGGISLTGTNASSFAQTNGCGSNLAAGANCTISITFTPIAGASYMATLSIADNATGSPQTVTLNGTGSASPTFTLVSTTPSATITPTMPVATYPLVVTPQNGSFSSPVSFTASGVPSGYTASFSPATVTPGGSAANTTMTIKANSTVGRVFRIGSMPTLTLLALSLWPYWRRRRIHVTFLAFLSLATAATLFGCAGSSKLSFTPSLC